MTSAASTPASEPPTQTPDDSTDSGSEDTDTETDTDVPTDSGNDVDEEPDSTDGAAVTPDIPAPVFSSSSIGLNFDFDDPSGKKDDLTADAQETALPV